MLKIGLTGGIASGKSLVSARFKEHGAVLVDADELARRVVEPGTPGLAAVVRRFGSGVLSADGFLDRPALGALIFADAGHREALNAIIHPLVRAAAAELTAAASAEDIVVQDIPLLVETGQGAAFHLVVVVDTPLELQVRRMLTYRSMTADDAAARIRAQAARADRLAAADVAIDNSGSMAETLMQVDRLWAERLVPFARNLHRSRAARSLGPALLVPADPRWPAQAARLAQRITACAAGDVLAVDHIGSTAVPGMAAKDVLDLQLRVRSLTDADAMAPALAAAGFPRLPGQWRDTPKAFDPDPAHWQKRLHGSADPGLRTNVHIRVDGSSGARYALAFRDWLRADARARDLYLAEKQRVAALHAADPDTSGYAGTKEAWFNRVARPGLEEWVKAVGWQAPWETGTE